jgi:hydrogenase expression/formation protein HypE
LTVIFIVEQRELHAKLLITLDFSFIAVSCYTILPHRSQFLVDGFVMIKPFPTGKLPAEFLASLLARVPHSDSRVIFGPGVGQDAAVIDQGDHYLVVKSDPITFATDDIGWYAVNVNANDIACMGACPKWFLANALLPANRADAAMAQAIFNQIVEACAALNVELVGGHTEITYDLPRPIIMGSMLGEVGRDNLVLNNGAAVGDVLLLTKAIPLEGATIIAHEKMADLRRRGFSDAYLAHVKDFLHTPGISIVREARIASENKLATAMHDPTEGGLATGLRELAQAANVGLAIYADTIPVLPEGATLCAMYGLDPLGLIASGSLLITTPSSKAGRLRELLGQAGIPCTQIGSVVPPEEGLMLIERGQRRALPRFQADEITRVF